MMQSSRVAAMTETSPFIPRGAPASPPEPMIQQTLHRIDDGAVNADFDGWMGVQKSFSI